MRPELRALTGLRGVAATVVALSHLSPSLPYDLQLFFRWHNAAVDLFFCLSGFTLSYVYSRKTFDFASYLTARFARIYPLYFVTLAAAGAAMYIWPPTNIPTTYPTETALSDFLRQVFMINSWPLVGSGVHWNFQAWSISIEWFCYLFLFPALLFQNPPRSASNRLLCLVAFLAISFSSFFVAYADVRLIDVAKIQLSDWVSLLRGVLGFAAGWIVFASFESRDDLHAFSTRFSTAIWAGFVTVLILSYVDFIHSQAVVFLFPFVVLAATDPTSITSRVLASRAVHFLGVISYSIYMMHFIVFIVFVRLFDEASTWPMSVYALLIITTFIVSIVTYFAVEMPARNLVRGLRRMQPARLVQ